MLLSRARVLENKKYLPRLLKDTLRPLHEKMSVVLDEKLLRDTAKYFGLSEYEVISIAKMWNQLNATLQFKTASRRHER
jgi:hypothetical protein